MVLLLLERADALQLEGVLEELQENVVLPSESTGQHEVADVDADEHVSF